MAGLESSTTHAGGELELGRTLSASVCEISPLKRIKLRGSHTRSFCLAHTPGFRAWTNVNETRPNHTNEVPIDDRDLLEASPSAGWRTTYAVLNVTSDREVSV